MERYLGSNHTLLTPIWVRLCTICRMENEMFGQNVCTYCRASDSLPECFLFELLRVCWTCMQCYGINLRSHGECNHCGGFSSETFTSNNSTQRRPAALIREFSSTKADLQLFTTDFIPQDVHSMAETNNFAFKSADVLSIECAILMPYSRTRQSIIHAMVNEMRVNELKNLLLRGTWDVARAIVYSRLHALQLEMLRLNLSTCELIPTFATGILQEIFRNVAAEVRRQQVTSNLQNVMQTILQASMQEVFTPGLSSLYLYRRINNIMNNNNRFNNRIDSRVNSRVNSRFNSRVDRSFSRTEDLGQDVNFYRPSIFSRFYEPRTRDPAENFSLVFQIPEQSEENVENRYNIISRALLSLSLGDMRGGWWEGEDLLLSQMFENAELPPSRGLSEELQNKVLGLKDTKEISENCAVCQCSLEENEELENEVWVEIKKCKHQFHKDCLKPWLNDHNTCPVCRIKLDEDENNEEN